MESMLIAPVLRMGQPGGSVYPSSGTKFPNVDQHPTCGEDLNGRGARREGAPAHGT